MKAGSISGLKSLIYGLFIIAFPSTPYFLHRVHPVKKGYRVTLVDWYGGTILANADVISAGVPGPRPDRS